MNNYVITEYRGGILSSVFLDNRPVEIIYENRINQSLIGNIYIGRVQNIVKNIQAAFVEITKDFVCYLPLNELVEPVYLKKGASASIQQGDELLVQITKDAAKTKQFSVSSRLNLTGKYVVLLINETGMHISSKIPKKERAIFEKLELPQSALNYGWIIRTEALGTDFQLIKEEMEQLSAMADKIMLEAPHRFRGTCLYQTQKKYLSYLKKRSTGKLDRIVTDQEEIYEEIRSFLMERMPHLVDKLEFYQDRMLPLSKLYCMDSVLEKALQEKVWMKSGGYLVIQPTEALTVIDVNTGKAVGKGNLEEHYLKINREAAKESAHQIRLRNISGIIMIDFINMKKKEHEEEIMDLLKELLKEDSHTARVIDMTPLGLVEITRKREEPSLREQLKYIDKKNVTVHARSSNDEKAMQNHL
ncbi:MAG: ribonuclease E/G, partial [Muricoprocola sp.]